MIGCVTDWYDASSLPKYRHPPVSEIAIAIEFPVIPGFDFYRLTRLQAKWEDRYPTISDRPGAPPSPPIFENQGVLQFNFGDAPRRIWAEAAENGLLVQTQSDRLILNWRKDFSAFDYPGYLPVLRPEFERLWGELVNFLAENGLPSPIPLIAEFNYINTVPLANEDELQDVVTVVRSPASVLPGRDRLARFQFVRDVAASSEHPYAAQIQVQGEPVERVPGQRELVFTVVARVLLGEKSAAPLEGLDAAHALASHTFSRIVTDAKQVEWERLQ
jgi:uncharacterized protein (TIGR04255 family)